MKERLEKNQSSLQLDEWHGSAFGDKGVFYGKRAGVGGLGFCVCLNLYRWIWTAG